VVSQHVLRIMVGSAEMPPEVRHILWVEFKPTWARLASHPPVGRAFFCYSVLDNLI
jgi:hypothetical protein